MRKKWFIFTTALFIALLVWRAILHFTGKDVQYDAWFELWGSSYQFVAFFGAVYCFLMVRSIGFSKIISKVLFFLGIALLGQSFGQLSYGYLIYIGADYYPSFGDIGYFLSDTCYLVAAYYLLHLSGFHQTLNKSGYIILGVVIWAILMLLSIYLFLYGHDYSTAPLLVKILDTSYVVIDTLYISIAGIALIVSRKYLGGILFTPILIFFLALLAQYSNVFAFSYQEARDIYNPGFSVDIMALFAYYIMASAVFVLDHYYYRVTK